MMVFQSVERHPKGSVVAQRRRGKDDVVLSARLVFGHQTGRGIENAKPSIDFLLGLRGDRMGRFWSDDVRQLKALFHGKFPTGFGHDVGGLLLLIDLTAVGDRRDRSQIANPNRAIVHGP